MIPIHPASRPVIIAFVLLTGLSSIPHPHPSRRVPDQMILGLDIRPSGIGVAVGGDLEDAPPMIEWTDDGGASWHTSDHPGAHRLYDVQVISDSVAVAVGLGGQVLFSGDGGRTWIRSRGAPVGWIASVRFTDVRTGFIGGIASRRPVLNRTQDGGRTWVDVIPPDPSIREDASVRKIRFFEERIGLAVGDQGLILRSGDGGTTWRRVPAPTSTWLRDIAFLDARTVLIAGSDGVVLRSRDSGRTWEALPGVPRRKFNAVHISADGRVHLAEAEGALITARLPVPTWESLTLPDGFVGTTFEEDPAGVLLLAGSGGRIIQVVPAQGAVPRYMKSPIGGTGW